jgi:SAM-dependent methyltransferase
MARTVHTFLSDVDLSETQVYLTMQTYDRFAREYAAKWEWSQATIKEITKYNLKPFFKFAKKGGSVLLAGCQSGRDHSFFSRRGFRCLGTEFSFGLLTEALRRVPDGLFLRADARSLPFMPASFDAVYADALVHIPKKDFPNTLRDFRIFLKSRGILYLSLLLGEKNVWVMDDLGSKRYMTLFRKAEVLELIKNLGLKVLWSAVSPYTEPDLPNWFSLIAQKP